MFTNNLEKSILLGYTTRGNQSVQRCRLLRTRCAQHLVFHCQESLLATHNTKKQRAPVLPVATAPLQVVHLIRHGRAYHNGVDEWADIWRYHDPHLRSQYALGAAVRWQHGTCSARKDVDLSCDSGNFPVVLSLQCIPE